MPVKVVVGLQYGDEGKGRIVDDLSKDADIGARFNGGSNSGHTIHADGKKYVSHLLAAAALRGKPTLICPSVLVNIDVLRKDMEALGVPGKLVFVDPRCPVVLPDHIRRDSGSASEKIGTTKQGMGPCMSDRVSRVGLTVGDIAKSGGMPEVNVCDTFDILYSAYKKGENIIFEGAQGFQIDIWHGTYPYCTSSSVLSGCVCTSSGLPPNMIDEVYGVFKAYTTRVGEGPFRAEITGGCENELRQAGEEYGATTGRPRRCGWLDIEEVSRAIKMNGVSSLVMTKIDVLSKLQEVFIVHGNKGSDRLSVGKLDSVNPSMKHFNDLPASVKRYIDVVSEMLEHRINIVSIGKERDAIINIT